MDILNRIHSKTVFENEKHLHFWEGYLNSLKSLNLEQFSGKLTVPVMVPVGSRILFRGELKHTNEVTVSLGADYFAKCSIKQADILRQHRIKVAQSKLDMLRLEKQYIENQMSFSKQNVYNTVGQEIVEVYSENEDKAWREKHRENVKKYKLDSRNKPKVNDDINDDSLWDRLDELELQEELENEHVPMDYTTTTSIFDDKQSITNEDNETTYTQYPDSYLDIEKKSFLPENVSKLDLLQQVLNKQNEIEYKLQEMKQREKSTSDTETELLSRLDEMEKLDELEDEMDRLHDIILSENAELSNSDIPVETSKLEKRSVSFADNDSDTLELTFRHSEVQPSIEPYIADKGIQKPSDLYAVYKSFFSNGTTSILKKTRNECDTDLKPNTTVQYLNDCPPQYENVNRPIVIEDIQEKNDCIRNTPEISHKRPTSLFKMKRMQKKDNK